MQIAVPSGWSVLSRSEFAFAAAHKKHALELDISPVYKSSRSGRNGKEEPSFYRVALSSDWFSEEILGDVSRSARAETKAEAIEYALEFMGEHAPKDSPANTPTGAGPTEGDTGESIPETEATTDGQPSATETDEESPATERQTQAGGSTRSSAPSRGPVSTGSATLDEILDGGYPGNRSILVTGTPGTGKSTLAMQFLQAGLQDGDRCLYVSTEQTYEEIRDAFDSFEFDLSHDELGVSTIHSMAPTDGDGQLQVGSLGTEQTETTRRFDRAGVVEFLRRGRSADRIVLDSVSGLQGLADSDTEYRHALLDIVRLFNDEFDATALLTAETYDTSGNGGVETIQAGDAVQYTLHGVIRLWRERISGQLRRFLDVRKMRGVDHDTRPFEIEFEDEGIDVIARKRPETGRSIEYATISSGVGQLDDRLGGGFQRGGGVLLEYDEQADIDPLLMAIGSEALDQMLSVAFVPGADTDPRRLSALLAEMGAEMETMLENDQLFVVDVYGGWSEEASSANVFQPDGGLETVQHAFEEIDDRAVGSGTAFVVDVPSVIHSLGPRAARELRNWQEARVVDAQDILFNVSNPDLLAPDVASFFANAAQQIVSTWVTENGLQYLKIRKGTTAEVGSVGLVEFVEEKPYIRLR